MNIHQAALFISKQNNKKINNQKQWRIIETEHCIAKLANEHTKWMT